MRVASWEGEISKRAPMTTTTMGALKHVSYSNMRSTVKWDGSLSAPFEINQGVKQGGIPSTTDYKTYIDPLIRQISNSCLGLKINDVDCSAPTVADDILLLADSAVALQAMLSMAERYAKEHKYNLHPKKSCITVFGSKQQRELWKDVSPWSIGENTLPVVDCTTHLGIRRDASSPNPVSEQISERVCTGRRTAYALMGAGLHGLNGLHPLVSLHIYKTYVVPRIISGLESVVISPKDLQKLEVFHRGFLKQIKNLPASTASSAIFILTGTISMEAEIHRNQITLFGSIARSNDTTIKKLAKKQLAAKDLPKNSWFKNLCHLHQKYELPSPAEILEAKPSKGEWKSIVKKAISSNWTSALLKDLTEKSSLRYFHPEDASCRQPHRLWTNTNYDRRDVRRGCIKAKLVSRTYQLQENRARFNQYEVDPQCQMCRNAPETMSHFLIQCAALEDVRRPHMDNLQKLIPTRSMMDTETMEQAILNCPGSIQVGEYTLNLKPVAHQIEQVTRGLCYALHCKRALLMEYRC